MGKYTLRIRKFSLKTFGISGFCVGTGLVQDSAITSVCESKETRIRMAYAQDPPLRITLEPSDKFPTVIGLNRPAHFPITGKKWLPTWQANISSCV